MDPADSDRTLMQSDKLNWLGNFNLDNLVQNVPYLQLLKGSISF